MTGQYGHPPYRLPGTGTGLPSRPQLVWKGVPGCVVMFLPALAAIGLAYLVRWAL